MNILQKKSTFPFTIFWVQFFRSMFAIVLKMLSEYYTVLSHKEGLSYFRDRQWQRIFPVNIFILRNFCNSNTQRSGRKLSETWEKPTVNKNNKYKSIMSQVCYLNVQPRKLNLVSRKLFWFVRILKCFKIQYFSNDFF